MNRRQLLHTLSVVTAAGAWAGFSNGLSPASVTIPLPIGETSLLAALTQSKWNCESILGQRESLSQRCSSDLVDCLTTLPALIDQAESRVAKRSHLCPAFWQACSDAFLRTAKHLSACKGVNQPSSVVIRQAEAAFLRTAQLLNVQTVRAAARHPA